MLQCRTTGQPAPSITWYREEGGAVEIGERIVVSGSGDLTISSVALSDAGEYYCMASNVVGSVRSLSASLDIAGTHLPFHLCYGYTFVSEWKEGVFSGCNSAAMAAVGLMSFIDNHALKLPQSALHTLHCA